MNKYKNKILSGIVICVLLIIAFLYHNIGLFQTDNQAVKNEKSVNENTFTCSISIKCNTILNNLNLLNQDKIDIIPADGVILKEQKVDFTEGETVFDILKRVTKDNKIHMEFVSTPVYNSMYIEGIANIYEFDCGELSGWQYSVNGKFSSYGCSHYILKDGDKIEWVYTCDLGKDVGGRQELLEN